LARFVVVEANRAATLGQGILRYKSVIIEDADLLLHASFPAGSSLLGHQGDGPAPAGAGAVDFDGQTGNEEPTWPGNLLQVGQFFDLAVFPLDPRKMSGPDGA
jgi:hypothetical protein